MPSLNEQTRCKSVTGSQDLADCAHSPPPHTPLVEDTRGQEPL